MRNLSIKKIIDCSPFPTSTRTLPTDRGPSSRYLPRGWVLSLLPTAADLPMSSNTTVSSSTPGTFMKVALPSSGWSSSNIAMTPTLSPSANAGLMDFARHPSICSSKPSALLSVRHIPSASLSSSTVSGFGARSLPKPDPSCGLHKPTENLRSPSSSTDSARGPNLPASS